MSKIAVVFFAFIFFFNKNSHSQVLDSAYLNARYQFTYRPDSNNLTTFREDIFVLNVGQKFTKFYSYYKAIADSITNVQSKNYSSNGSFSINDAKGIPTNGSSKIIFKNNLTNTYTITHTLILNTYKYSDSIPSINWVVTTDTATKTGYKCIKANTVFRGRSYQAWFTLDIPVSSGPYLFSGLPGLIVEIKDSKGDFEYKLLSLEVLTPKKPIVFDAKKNITVSRNEYRRLLKSMMNDMDGFAASQGMTFITKKINGVSNPPPPPKPPFNPIELE